MGAFVSKVWNKLFEKQPMKLLMVGLDAAGKTTILQQLKLAEHVQTLPTVGFNVETVEYRSLSFTIMDLGGQDKIRALWKYYYQNVDCIIFVVDSCDRDRINDIRDYENNAKEELTRMLNADELRNTSVLVYANKQDVKHAMTVEQIATALDLRNIARGHNWHIQGCCAVNGEGLYEGLNWIADNVQPASE